MPALRRWAAPAVLTIATVLTVAACDGDDSSQATGATTTAATTTTTISSSSTSGEPTTTTEPATPAIEVRVAGGKVQGGVRREQVRRGDAVVLRVVADVADEVHLHGYDRSADVGPGKPAQISFTADIPGVFEVELEQRRQKLLELEVR
jgi:predicted extracellular nuclease